ncbi:MAG TPA: protein kinase, partial [Pseudomonadota bacterium]|nr:protein kinase [Pseudomonadota bacterium]
MQLSPDPVPGYRVLHALDPDQQGSVADSVLAEDPARGQPVVVKRLHPHLQHLPHFASALRGAAQWAQQSVPRSSSGLVRVLALSASESSLSIVTEYVEGCSLRALVRKQAPSRRLPLSCVLGLIDQMIDLLLKNQERGLAFHGYLHPGNVLFSNQFAPDGQRIVLLDDWYIGRTVQSYCRQRVIDKRKTLAGMMLLGDLRFLSPEQCQELPDITSAADVYALGMLIYNLLSGQHPFESAEAHDLDLAIQQVQTVPEPLQHHEPSIPLELSQLVDETLRKIPGERPTLAALRERLRGCQQALLASRPFRLETPLGYNGICQQHAGHDAQGNPCVIARTQITRCQDRHERVLDRLAASLYLLNQSNLSGYRRVLRYERMAHDEMLLIAEALPGGSLADMLAAQNDSQDPARISKIVSIIHQVARLLRDTHEHNYVYLGLRPSGIWLVPGPDAVQPYRVVLLESETFRRGFSGERTISGSDRPEDLSPQTTRYVAPEQYYGAATPAADAFSLGAVLFEALNLRPPFATAELTDLRRRAEPEASLKPAQHDPSIDPELAALTNQLLSPLPRLRPTLAETEQRLRAIADRLRLAPSAAPPERAAPHATPAGENPRGQPATPNARSTWPEAAAPPRSTPGPLARGSTEDLRSDVGAGPDQRFSGYTITRSLGEGGHSEVFHVVETASGREFAIKEMRLNALRNGAALQRFNNELRFSQMVPHPGVIKCHQICHPGDGFPWMRMEYIAGRTLRARMAENRPVTPDEALQYARWISTVMVAVHAKRIVHRDLKPENIILTLDKADEYPIRVIDFGIAKQEQVNQTAVGTVMGTLCYMPPEQCRDAGMVDAKADVFALGAILYEMLCGWQAQKEVDVREYISNKKYAPIPSLPASLPREISRYVMRMLAYEPALRPTMEEAERTLRNLHKLAIHGYGAWLVGSLASYTSERLRQSALPLITGTLMVSTFAFGGYL